MSSIFEKTPINLEYKSPIGNRIALVAGTPNYNASLLDNALCKQIADCGFNLIATSVGVDYIPDSLNYCKSNGLKLFLYNATALSDEYASRFINKYKVYDGLGGWILKFSLLENDLKDTDLIEAYKRIVDLDPNHPVFIPINGDWEKDRNNQPINSFPSFISEVQCKFEPSFWTYIYFPDLTKTANDTEIGSDRILAFYRNLQYFAYISRYTVTPIWMYCRCQKITNYYGYYGAKPTLSSLRIIVFSALAYGLQGIYYWNYKKSPGSSYEDAPINENGVETDTWNLVKNVNEEVKAFNDVFAGCELLDARHFRNPWIVGLKKFENPIGPLLGIEKISNGKDLKYSFLISHLFNIRNGIPQNYLVILCNGYDQDNLIMQLNFSDYWKIYRLSKNADAYTEVEFKNKSLQFVASPGRYYIFRWE